MIRTWFWLIPWEHIAASVIFAGLLYHIPEIERAIIWAVEVIQCL
jgi:hypothetical protein